MSDTAALQSFVLNGSTIEVATDPSDRLSSVLRNELGLTGTKIGCGIGDCGSCTVLMDGEAVCACLVPVGQAAGANIITIEGLREQTRYGRDIQEAFLAHKAVQCGFCTPGLLMATSALLERKPDPTAADVEEALAGVLCRCTGYQKIISAVLSVAESRSADVEPATVEVGCAVGSHAERTDGPVKVQGAARFGADEIPSNALFLRAIRSPHHRARFVFGDIEQFVANNPNIHRVFTARDVPGRNLHGVAPAFADQPVFAVGETRFKGEAVAMIAGERRYLDAFDLESFPIEWEPLPPLLSLDDALAPDAAPLHPNRPGNIMIRGRVVRGDVDAALEGAAHIVEGVFETSFVEHAYLEPEAGWAKRVGDRVEIISCSQAPHAHRADIAAILAIPQESVRIVPSAVGGGFGGKLDLTVQPFLAVAAWHLRRPVAMVYSRAESIATSTKRHPARMKARIGSTSEGRIIGVDFQGDFNTGAYASWGSAVANRVPVHASGPYYVPHYRALTRAVHTHCAPAGAFRGFGVPQTAIAQEQLIDELALTLGVDALEFRLLNAARNGTSMVTGQILEHGVGITECLQALKPRWIEARQNAHDFNATAKGSVRRGVGLAAMFYGCGNTAMSNPSTVRLGLRPDGRVILHQGAVDVGQGSDTVIPQIVADALGVTMASIDILGADTDITPDCGRTSASRQTFVTGKAAELAALNLRSQLLQMTNAGGEAKISFEAGRVIVADELFVATLELGGMECNSLGYVLMAEETFDPPTTTLDQDGQGSPYAIYAYGAQIAEIEVDCALGTVAVLKVTAAHDVGRSVNPALLEGQIEGGVAQGVGLALMEEFIPARNENLHDYLIPGVRDVPKVDTILINVPADIGPFGAKGIGEPSTVPTAAAILNAIRHATGKRITQTPATPQRIVAAIGAEIADRAPG